MDSAKNDQIEELKRLIEEERNAPKTRRRQWEIDNRERRIQYTKNWTDKNKEHRAKWSRERQRKRKEEMIALKGGKCVDCGGVFPPYAYDFHHVGGRDVKTTNFVGMSRPQLLAELEKCVLLCAICHRGRHAVEESSG